MPVAFILDFPRGALQQYDAVVDRMQLGGELPSGALFHVAGSGPSGGVRVVDVWETDAAFAAFADSQIGPLSAEAGLDPPEILRFEVAATRDAGVARASLRFFQVVRLPLDEESFRRIDDEVVGGAEAIPDGLVFHVNGPLPDGGWIVADGWTSRQARDRFMAERVMPAAERHGLTPPPVEEFEVHNALEPAAVLTREDIIRAIDEQDAAFNRHDPAGVAAMYAQEAVVRDQAAGDPIRGRQGVQEYVGGYLNAFPDLRWERVGMEIDGTVAVEQWRVSGTHDGDLPGLSATHRRMSVDGCSVLHFGADGLVHAEENYWDEAAMLRQLGALDPVPVS